MLSHLLKIFDNVKVKLSRRNGYEDRVEPRGHHVVEHFRDGVKIGEHIAKNSVTNQGKNSWLGIMFHADTQITSWYIGLLDNAGWTSENVADTLASHSGWSENNNYSGNRLSWSPGASASQSITNGTAVQFTMTGSATLKGIFVCSVASGTSGTLWSTADFGSTVPVNNGDVLKITYTVNS